MASTLIAPALDATIDDARPLLFDTMRAIVEHRRGHRAVPVHLLDELRVFQLVELADAIDRYNDRVTRVRPAASA